MSKPLIKTNKTANETPIVSILLLATFSALTIYFSYQAGKSIIDQKAILIPYKFALAPLIPFIITLIITVFLYIKNKSKFYVFFVEFVCTVSIIFLIYFLYLWLNRYYIVPHNFFKYFSYNIKQIMSAFKGSLNFFLLISPIFLIFFIAMVKLYLIIFDSTEDNNKKQINEK